MIKKVGLAAVLMMGALGQVSAIDARLSYSGELWINNWNAKLTPMLVGDPWRFQMRENEKFTASTTQPDGTEVQPFAFFDNVPGTPVATGTVAVARMDNALRITYAWRMTCATFASKGQFVYLRFPEEALLKNARWCVDGGTKTGTFPTQHMLAKRVFLQGTYRQFTLQAEGRTLTIDCGEARPLMFQDDRAFSPTFSLRLGMIPARHLTADDEYRVTLTLSDGSPVTFSSAKNVVIRQNKNWVPVDYKKDIECGSAMDFSQMGFRDAPAGKYGWLRNVEGHFEFEQRPGIPQRFYGLNFVGSLNFLDAPKIDLVLTRLERLGYNSIRLHHFDNELVRGSKDRVTLNPQKLDQFDRLVAEAIQRGFYLTIDLFMSRSMPWSKFAIDRKGDVFFNDYKAMLPFDELVWEDFATFTRNLMTHVNPYTGRTYADEPGIPLVSAVNEGRFRAGWDSVRELPKVRKGWREWLAHERAADAHRWPGADLEMPPPANKALAHDGALVAFWIATEERLFTRIRHLLKDELKMKAMLTNQNCSPHYPAQQSIKKALYDYHDNHFYVDHPRFLTPVRWALPTRAPNVNPVGDEKSPLCRAAFERIRSMPYTITEWNFSGPGKYRGMGGILTGAMAARQDWDGLWRFAYAHGRQNIENGVGLPRYFDASTDPLVQLSDKATMLLFLRGDISPLAHERVFVIPPDTPPVNAEGRLMELTSHLSTRQAWTTRMANDVTAPLTETTPRSLADERALRLDADGGSFVIDTPRTAGGFTPRGEIVTDVFRAHVAQAPATVWVSSLDGKPVPESERLLLTHLTDIQSDGIVYAEPERCTLLAWGKQPAIAEVGEAAVSIKLNHPMSYRVWALDTTGHRVREIPAKAQSDQLEFVANIRDEHGRARFLYEIIRTR